MFRHLQNLVTLNEELDQQRVEVSNGQQADESVKQRRLDEVWRVGFCLQTFLDGVN